nr:uncharacterized protein LOC123752434 [Procambarus clarkii]
MSPYQVGRRRSVSECVQPEIRTQETNSNINLPAELTAIHGNYTATSVTLGDEAPVEFSVSECAQPEIRTRGTKSNNNLPAKLTAIHGNYMTTSVTNGNEVPVKVQAGKRHTSSGAQKVNPCSQCTRTYKSRKWFNRHIRKIHKRRKSVNNLSAELTAMHGNYNAASVTHGDEVPVKVPAGKLLTSSGGQKDFPCPHCPKCYTLIKWRNRHISNKHMSPYQVGRRRSGSECVQPEIRTQETNSNNNLPAKLTAIHSSNTATSVTLGDEAPVEFSVSECAQPEIRTRGTKSNNNLPAKLTAIHGNYMTTSVTNGNEVPVKVQAGKRHTSSGAQKVNPCSQCTRTYKSRKWFNRHIRKIHKRRKSVNNLSAELTAMHGNYTAASVTHGDEVPVKVPAGKLLTSSGGQKDFPCPHCPKCYTLIKWRNRHISNKHMSPYQVGRRRSGSECVQPEIRTQETNSNNNLPAKLTAIHSSNTATSVTLGGEDPGEDLSQ